jgi:hypothetical protein
MGIGDNLSIMISQPKLPTWTTMGRPTGIRGLYGGNVVTGKIEWFDGAQWLNADGTAV